MDFWWTKERDRESEKDVLKINSVRSYKKECVESCSSKLIILVGKTVTHDDDIF